MVFPFLEVKFYGSGTHSGFSGTGGFTAGPVLVESLLDKGSSG
jgi:hypothetical protein